MNTVSVTVKKTRQARKWGLGSLEIYLVRGVGRRAIKVMMGRVDEYRYRLDDVAASAAKHAVKRGWRTVVVDCPYDERDIEVTNVDSFFNQSWTCYPSNSTWLGGVEEFGWKNGHPLDYRDADMEVPELRISRQSTRTAATKAFG
jgi:hypothetical protein